MPRPAGTRRSPTTLANILPITLLVGLLLFSSRPVSAQVPSRSHELGFPSVPANASLASDPAFAARPPPLPADVPEAPKRSEPPVAFDVALAFEMPILIGAQATFEAPYRFLFQGSIGVLPGFSVDAVDSVLVGSGAYDQTTSELVRNTLRDSLVVRLSGGWRPFPAHGFEILGGYTLTSLGGAVSARQAVEAAAGVALPAEIPDADIMVRSTVHSVHVSLGWRWVIADHFLIRTSLGYLQSVASSSELEVPPTIAQAPGVAANIDSVNRALDTRLNDIYTTYVKLPVVGLALGYRF